jgi:hypothetical protein
MKASDWLVLCPRLFCVGCVHRIKAVPEKSVSQGTLFSIGRLLLDAHTHSLVVFIWSTEITETTEPSMLSVILLVRYRPRVIWPHYRGAQGDAGTNGANGAKGDRGDTGLSGVVRRASIACIALQLIEAFLVEWNRRNQRNCWRQGCRWCCRIGTYESHHYATDLTH